MSNVVVEIILSGPTFASLWHDISTKSGHTDGLLFGTMSSRTVDVSTDSANQREIRVTYAIQRFEPLEVLGFYDVFGRLKDTNKITQCCNQKECFLGWYTFRRNTPLRPTLRESLVYANLCECFKSLFKSANSPDFELYPLLALFTSSISEENNIYSWEYRFLQKQQNNPDLKPLGLTVTNMVNSSQNHETDFKALSPLTMKSPFASTDIFGKLSYHLMSSLPDIDSTPPPNIALLEKFYMSTLSMLKNAGDEVFRGKEQITQLLAEIEQLKNMK